MELKLNFERYYRTNIYLKNTKFMSIVVNETGRRLKNNKTRKIIKEK